jgi:phage gp37-like protein
MHEFEQAEDAVIAKLLDLKSLGLRVLKPYSGQLDVKTLNEITLQFPFIYVAAPSLQTDSVNRYDDYKLEVLLIVGDKNVRSATAPTRGDSTSPGVYALLEWARTRLLRKVVLTGWTPLALHTEQPLIYAPQDGICIYTAVYSAQTVK